MTPSENETNSPAPLVGADGARSRVRPLLCDVSPSYVGISFVESYLFDCDNRHKASAQAVGGGALFALAPGKGILAHREPDGVLHAYLALTKPQEWLSGINFSDPSSARNCIVQEFNDWAPALTALITDGDTNPVPRTITALPIDLRWNRVPGVTLLGDAAHLMSPFAGEGANLAMYDGAELGRCIATNIGAVEAALSAYERDLFPRSASAALEAERNLELCFNEKAPYGIAELLSGYQPVK